jgi:hypothetical protein
MSKHAKDEQVPKRRLWPAVTTVVVVAVAAASAIALTGGSGPSVLTSDTAHNAAVKLAAVPTVTSKTFYGCEWSTGNRKVFDLSLTKLRCPSGSHRVSWRGWVRPGGHRTTTPASAPDTTPPSSVFTTPPTSTSTTTPPSSSPTTTSPSASPTTTSPSPDPTTSSPASTGTCTTSAAKGSCGPYTYPQIQGNPSEITVGQDVWNPISGWQQTLTATNPGNWQVTANMPDKNTAVISFPNTGANYNSPQLSSFPAIYSSFSETMGSSSATNAHAAYDLWFNDWKNEVMIQTDFAPSGARCSSYEASATFGGSNGVPIQKWSLCQFGSELIWQMPTNEASGSVDIKAMTTWLENNGYMPQNSTVTALSYGFEIASTGGQNQTFRVSNFSITT